MTLEIERLNVLKDGQAGFRKRRGVIDNVYIMKHIVENELKRKNGKLYALFIDFKAAFDRVDRAKVWEYLKDKGVNIDLIERVKELYEDTVCRVKVNGEMSDRFKVKNGLRQGCPMSALLFISFVADMDEMLARAQEGGVVVGREKVWSLAYADDMVVVAKGEKEMKGMIGNLEKYVRRKGLEVNVRKTKMMVFSKAGGRKRKYEWKWNGEEVQQVSEFKYLGYTMNERNTEAAHVREIGKKANKLMGIVWSIGERKFGHDVDRRIRMFDCLIKSVMMYGAEIWGWKEQEAIERVHERYLRWVLGVDREVPGYIVREELKREKMKVEAGKRAVKFEDRMREREECKLLQECWKERRGRLEEDKEGRRKYYERVGYASSEIEKERENGRWWWKELRVRDKDVDKQQRRERINESRYNRMYGGLIEEERVKYLRMEKACDRRLIARYRCGNEERENRYWKRDEERMCRMCMDGRETIDHLMKECSEVRESEIDRNEILKGGVEGLQWMKEIEAAREKIKTRGIGEGKGVVKS